MEDPSASRTCCTGSWRRWEWTGTAHPVSLEARSALYRSVLSGRRVLVVLDNQRSTDQGRYLLAPGETRQVRR
jgi:hypothetical protein